MLREYNVSFWRDELYTPSDDNPLIIIPIGNFELWKLCLISTVIRSFSLKIVFITSDNVKIYEEVNDYPSGRAHLNSLDYRYSADYLLLIPQTEDKYLLNFTGITIGRQ